MGNRAVVIFTTEDEKDISPCTYLQWNGGPESIYPFLAEMDRRKLRLDRPDSDHPRFCQIVGDFFDADKFGAYSLYASNGPTEITAEAIKKVANPGDNGVYVVCRAKALRVRRFNEDYPKDKGGKVNYDKPEFREFTAEDVAAEKKAADEHSYKGGIAETFLKIGGGRTAEGD